MKQSLKRGLVMLAAFAGVVCPFAVHATDYTYSNVDSDSLAVKSDGKFGTTSFSFQLSNPSANAATADFPASGYVQLTKISIGARSDNDKQTVTTATLTNNKTSESYAATVTYSSGNDFTAVKPDSWSRKEVKITFGTDGVLVDTTATYTLTFTATLGYSVVTTVSSPKTADWKPAMRIYGRTPSGSMEMPSSLIPSSGGMALPSTVTVKDATGMVIGDSSITLGNSGIQIGLGTALNYHTVMVKASAIPSSSSRLIGWMTGQYQSQDIENCAYYDGSSFNQCYFLGGTDKGNFNTGTDNRAWTRDASEHWVAASYARADNSGSSQTSGGTRTYFDGAEKVTSAGLKWGSNQTSKITLGGTATNDSNPATGMVVKDVVILSNALTANQITTVTAALNAGWTVNATGTTLTSDANGSSLPGYENVTVVGTVTVAADGTLDLSGLTQVQVGNGATLDVSGVSGLTYAAVTSGGVLTIGKQRPNTVVVAAGGTLAVASVATMSDRITGYTPTATLTVSGAIAGTVTLDGETVTPVVDGSTATLTGTAVAGNPTYTGNGWWWDFEFDGNGNNIGSEGVGLQWDSTRPTAAGQSAAALGDYTEAVDGNRMVHLLARPWRHVGGGSGNSDYPSEFTAVMFCKAGTTANGVLVAFGSSNRGASTKTIALATGAHPENGEMRLVLINGNNSAAQDLVAGGFTLDNITSANHLYAFTVETVGNVSHVSVFADGDLLTTYVADGLISLGNGFQIGSIHGSITSAMQLNYLADGTSGSPDEATMDFLRVSNVALSAEAIKALAAEYRYVSPNGIAERTLSANATWTDETNTSWAQKTLNEDGSSTTTEQAAPNSGTVVEITATADVQLTMDLASEVSYEKLTFQGSGTITVKAGGTAPTVTTRTYINTDVTMDIAAFASLGATTVADGKTLTVVPSDSGTLAAGIALGIRGETSEIVTGTVTLGDGASVVLSPSMVSDFSGYGFTLSLAADASERYVYTIARDDNPVHVTKRENGMVVYAMYPDAMSAQAAMFTLPAEPATIPADFASSVTIANNHATESLTVATAFAGGDLTVSSGTVILTGDITTSGTVALNSATTLSGNTVSSALTGSGAVTIDGTVTLADGGSIANTIGGTGTIDGSGRSSAPGAFTFGTWTGTVVLPELASIAGNTFSFNSYGITGSTVRVNGIGGGWLRSEEVNPTIDIPAGKTLTISAFSPSFNNTFKKLSGAGTFAVTHSAAVDTTAGDWYENYSAYYLIKDVSGFTGSLSTATPGIAIGSSKPGYQTAGGKIMVTGTLTGSCTLDEDVTFASGATLDATAGVPTVSGAVTLGGTLNVEMGEGFTPAAYTGAADQMALAASASGLTEDTVLTAATVKAAGSAVSNAVVVVKDDGLYVVKPTVPVVPVPEGSGVTEEQATAMAETIAELAAVAGVETVTYKTTGDDSFSADRAVLFPESLAVSAEGEVSTARPTFGIKSLTVKAVSSTNYVIIQAEAHNLADGGDIVLAGDLTESSAAATVKTALSLTDGTSEGVTTKWFVLDLPGSTTSYGVKATNE